MDMKKKKFEEAELYARNILKLKTGNYLDDFSTDMIRVDQNAYFPSVENWYRMKGFRRSDEMGHTLLMLKKATCKWIRSIIANGEEAIFTLQKKNGTLSILYGTEYNLYNDVFHSSIPECDIVPANWSNDIFYPYTGMLTGTLSSQQLADSFASSNIENGYIACIFSPVPDQEIQEKIQANQESIAYLDRFKSFQRVYGNATRRIEEISIPSIMNAMSILKDENIYLKSNIGKGFVRCVVRYGATNMTDYYSIISLIRSCIHTESDAEVYEPPRFFSFSGGTRFDEKMCLAIPAMDISNLELGTNCIHPFTLQDVESVASFCLPPANSYDGFYVKTYNITNSDMNIFPVSMSITERGIEIGNQYESRSKAILPHAKLLSHSFISGFTRSGKTTTTKKILTELSSEGIPFVVIEAAKKEYYDLIRNVPSLKIYTPGADGLMLKFNPLQPELGTLIENHAAAVCRAITASFGGEHPIPEAFDGLLKQTYHNSGWEYGMMAYPDSKRPFPTFNDLLKNVHSYIENHAQYGPEVKQNLLGALTLRTETLDQGALGQLFNSSDGLQAKDFLESSCVIELADLSSQSTEFLMNILLFKFHCYLSRQNPSSDLKKVIVVEEAHNVFKKTLSEDSGRALSNEYFEKMLAEIAATGTGLILSDQRPSLMSQAVIANTAVKIIHTTLDAEDRRVVGDSSNLSSAQAVRLSELDKGECIISIGGHHGVQHVKVSPPETEDGANNCACHVCTSQYRCQKQEVERILEKVNSSMLAFHVSKIMSNPYNTPLVESNIKNMLQDLDVNASNTILICLLGEILDRYSSSSLQEKRIITTAYAKYLRAAPM